LHGGSFRLLDRISPTSDDSRRAAQMLELVGLGDEINFPANVLPHGGKRKLELAILLAADPELLLLDEPTAGMASEQVPELMGIISTIAKQGDKTIVMVEHNMNVVMSVSDRITVMNLGEVLTEGTSAEIAADKTVQSVYLGELYDLGGVS
jgi:branched-chain amino acid transport system ATP-binding protein